MLNLVGIVFKFIITGKYAYIQIQDSSVVYRKGHHLDGSIFEVDRTKTTAYIKAGNNYITMNSSLLQTSLNVPDDSHRVILEEITEWSNEFYILRCQDLYLDDTMCFQPHKHHALTLQLALEPEELPYYIPKMTRPDGDEDAAPLISTDGVSLYHSNAWFWMRMVSDANSADSRAYDQEFIFGGNPYWSGLFFRFINIGNKHYLWSDEAGYLGSKDESLYFFDTPPESPVKLVFLDANTVFALSDGIYYYFIDFIKASYGETKRVNSIEHASKFQFVCIG